MRCFSCGSFNHRDVMDQSDDEKIVVEEGDGMEEEKVAHHFSLKELEAATQNFKDSNKIGEGGFGNVYKGWLNSGMVVAVKQLNLDGLQGHHEFIVEALILTMLHHENLVNLIGYCSHAQQKFLVYEFEPKGSLEDHLYDLEPEQQPLCWSTRMKVALGAARGLEYLHCTAKPPVIHRDIKSSNILLDNEFNAKLSDFGLAKLGPVGDKTHVSTCVMGTNGYCDPKYLMSGQLTTKSDIYSFGVVLMELITGRKAIFQDNKLMKEQNLVDWALKNRSRYTVIVDPFLKGKCSARSVRHAIVVASNCLHKEPSMRPTITEVVDALDFLASKPKKHT